MNKRNNDYEFGEISGENLHRKIEAFIPNYDLLTAISETWVGAIAKVI